MLRFLKSNPPMIGFYISLTPWLKLFEILIILQAITKKLIFFEYFMVTSKLIEISTFLITFACRQETSNFALNTR